MLCNYPVPLLEARAPVGVSPNSVYVDYQTQQRIIKDGGRWYAQTIARNGLPDVSS
jgi:hypothetical protein